MGFLSGGTPRGFCWFFGERTTATAEATAIDGSLRLRLRSSLRQSGRGPLCGDVDARLKPRSTSEATAMATATATATTTTTTAWVGFQVSAKVRAFRANPHVRESGHGAPGFVLTRWVVGRVCGSSILYGLRGRDAAAIDRFGCGGGSGGAFGRMVLCGFVAAVADLRAGGGGSAQAG